MEIPPALLPSHSSLVDTDLPSMCLEGVMGWGLGWGRVCLVFNSRNFGLFGITVHTVGSHCESSSQGYIFTECIFLQLLWPEPLEHFVWPVIHGTELRNITLKTPGEQIYRRLGLLWPSLIYGFLLALYSFWHPLGSGTQRRHLCICGCQSMFPFQFMAAGSICCLLTTQSQCGHHT